MKAVSLQKKYDPALPEAIRQKQRIVREGGLDILVKPVPDDDRPGVLDRRFLAGIPLFVRITGKALCPLIRLILSGGNAKSAAARMRRYFNGVRSLPLAEGVSVSRKTVKIGDAGVGIRIYRKEGAASNAPVLYYIHGGGFAAGHPDVVEEICRQLVRRSGCIGVQVDYRLAPEHPYPAAFDDCYGVLRWIAENAADFGGDGGRISIAGDSAGGNLAAACAMRDRDEGRGTVKAQILLYPVVNPAGKEDGYFHFSLDQYKMRAGYKAAASFMITVMQSGVSGMTRVLGGDGPYLSPYFGKLEGLPPCLVLYGEFDYFRLESEAYARKLSAAGVPVRAVRYSGLSHAFAELIGIQPQAEDCMAEIAGFIKEIFSRQDAAPFA